MRTLLLRLRGEENLLFSSLSTTVYIGYRETGGKRAGTSRTKEDREGRATKVGGMSGDG